jgi:hypothetical protein
MPPEAVQVADFFWGRCDHDQEVLFHGNLLFHEDGKGFDLQEQIAPAKHPLDSGAGREWIETERPEKLGPNGVALRAVALDVAQRRIRGPGIEKGKLLVIAAVPFADGFNDGTRVNPLMDMEGNGWNLKARPSALPAQTNIGSRCGS